MCFQLAHPVLAALASTERRWLVELLYAFNSGNISRFDELKSQWTKQPDLAQHEIPMRQKISLLCLMEVCVSPVFVYGAFFLCPSLTAVGMFYVVVSKHQLQPSVDSIIFTCGYKIHILQLDLYLLRVIALELMISCQQDGLFS